MLHKLADKLICCQGHFPVIPACFGILAAESYLVDGDFDNTPVLLERTILKYSLPEAGRTFQISRPNGSGEASECAGFCVKICAEIRSND